jgi:hypothetical protein
MSFLFKLAFTALLVYVVNLIATSRSLDADQITILALVLNVIGYGEGYLSATLQRIRQ